MSKCNEYHLIQMGRAAEQTFCRRECVMRGNLFYFIYS